MDGINYLIVSIRKLNIKSQNDGLSAKHNDCLAAAPIEKLLSTCIKLFLETSESDASNRLMDNTDATFNGDDDKCNNYRWNEMFAGVAEDSKSELVMSLKNLAKEPHAIVKMEKKEEPDDFSNKFLTENTDLVKVVDSYVQTIATTLESNSQQSIAKEILVNKEEEEAKPGKYNCFQCDHAYQKRKSLILHYTRHPSHCYDCGEERGERIEVT